MTTMFCSYEASKASPAKNLPDIETVKQSARLARLHYLRNAELMLDPWILVWQLMQGVISDDPAPIE
jgi:hypothetical protein